VSYPIQQYIVPKCSHDCSLLSYILFLGSGSHSIDCTISVCRIDVDLHTPYHEFRLHFHHPGSTLCLCNLEQGGTSSSGLALTYANLAAVATSHNHKLLVMHLIAFSVGALSVNSKQVATVIQVSSVAKVGAERYRQAN